MPKAKPLTIAETIARLTRVGERMGMDTPVADFRMDTVENGRRTRWVPKVPQAPRYRISSGSGACTGDRRCTGTDVHMTGCPVLIAAVGSGQRQPVMVG
jgi:hypothetical protein